jgi:hypothetical protein
MLETGRRPSQPPGHLDGQQRTLFPPGFFLGNGAFFSRPANYLTVRI